MRISKTIFHLFSIGLLAAILVAGWFVYDFFSFKRTPLNVVEPTVFPVSPGASLSRVARDLQAGGMIENTRYFSLLGRLYDRDAKIQAGEYLIEPGIKPLQLLDKMAAGAQIQYAFTIIEGWTFHQMLDQLHQHEKIQPTLVGLDSAEIMAQLGRAGEHPEGRFLPETYHFPAGMSDLEFLKRAYAAMENALAGAWEGRDEGLPYSTPYEAMIMASIIEKETAVPAERPEIAGVFVRRLQKRMRLQTDPTVIYGIGVSFDGNIRRRDLVTDTPYNTYTRHGLPPTPIALPSAEAIQAALHPAPGDTLYFVSKGDGSHQFSATLEEHINAVRKYQLKRHN